MRAKVGQEGDDILVGECVLLAKLDEHFDLRGGQKRETEDRGALLDQLGEGLVANGLGGVDGLHFPQILLATVRVKLGGNGAVFFKESCRLPIGERGDGTCA